MTIRFDVLCRDLSGSARVGRVTTAHGTVETPVFMPVGTQATVKALAPDDLRRAGAEVVLANTYHLHLRPGSELIARMGGLHRFMAWDRPILTDSGGFQVFSLGHLRKIDDDGVTFRSHIDGSTHRFTPESVVEIQANLGSDIAMVLDECTPYPSSEAESKAAVERTTEWARRSKKIHTRQDQVLFGIAQGGMYAHLRRESAAQLLELGFPGNAIGGLSVGEPKELFYEMLAVSASALREDRPRYVMGVGAPEDLFECVSHGIDMFDCVLQTRLGRNGSLFTGEGRINIKNARFREIDEPVDADCSCYTCRTFSVAYLHHLFKADELLAFRLASLHNVHWTIDLVSQMRRHIRQGDFADFRHRYLATYRPTDAETREDQKRLWLRGRQETHHDPAQLDRATDG